MAVTCGPFDEARLAELMRWFPDEASCRLWGGPHFRWPYDAATFREDTRIDVLASRMLVADDGAMLAFGQYYLRVGRCHLGHLAVCPAARGRGIGTRLIRELCAEGRRALGVAEFSLFVLARNAQAERLYRRLGFEEASYPEALPILEPARYLVAAGEAAQALGAATESSWSLPNCE
jgi:ribosomal protein S18 acetylase RimI-like enzyme